MVTWSTTDLRLLLERENGCFPRDCGIADETVEFETLEQIDRPLDCEKLREAILQHRPLWRESPEFLVITVHGGGRHNGLHAIGFGGAN